MAEHRPLTPDMPRRQAIRQIAAALAAAGIDEPLREARLLVCAALGLSPAALIAGDGEPLGAGAAPLAAMAARRAAREPFARILGRREFYGHDFSLSEATLIPRPDTEALVEAILAEVRARGMAHRTIAIADLGVGSGAILAALLHALPMARGLAVDLSAAALATARANIERIVGTGRVAYHHGRWLETVTGRFDIIASNPPYIPSAEIGSLAPEVRLGDPALALDGGADGLAAYRAIAAQAQAALAPRGFLALEIGAGQAPAVTGMFAAQGFAPLAQRRDLGGHIRALLFEPGHAGTGG